MHTHNHFKPSGVLTAAIVGASMTVEAMESQETDSDIITSVIEFKSTPYS